MDIRKAAKQLWHFLWVEDSVWSWIANAVLAFVLIKFVVYPGLGLLLGTPFPVVAVVSKSMEHTGNFNAWWEQQGQWYEAKGISKDEFRGYTLSSGFNKGDIIILWGKEAQNIKRGDIIVFKTLRPDPIIHRVVGTGESFQTKGDNNPDSIIEYRLADGTRVPKGNPQALRIIDETGISEDQILGTAFFRIPFIGWIKIIFVDLISLFH
ncbi:MAG TPA: signal peptidase I [Candidatus Nanoarchaeia archaeon]|nr:signal peptidase I [Candidatus Nanoarchaeia archaeon]